MQKFEVAGIKVDSPQSLGVNTNRKMTDKLCLVAYLIVLTTFIAFSAKNIKYSKLEDLIAPSDSEGNLCGRVNHNGRDLTAYKFLFLDVLAHDHESNGGRRLCVKECPIAENTKLDCYSESNEAGFKEPVSYKSSQVYPGVCLPTERATYQRISIKASKIDVSKIIISLASHYKTILASIAVAVISCLVFSRMMKFFMWPTTVFTILAVYAAVSYLGMISWNKYRALLQDSEGVFDSDNLKKAAGTYKLIAYGLWLLTGLLIFVTIALFSKIAATVRIISAAGKFVSDTKLVTIIPLLATGMLMIFSCFSTIAAFSLQSNGELQSKVGSIFSSATLSTSQSTVAKLMILTVLWTISLILAISQFSISIAVCLWNNNGREGSSFTAIRALYWTIRYHIGTLAFGSLLMSMATACKATCRFILERLPEADTPGINCVLKAVVNCLVTAAERMIKYFTSQVYVQVALSSDNFCEASSKVYKSISVKLVKFEAICECFFMISKLLISCFTTAVAHFMISRHELTDAQKYTDSSVKLITLCIVFALSWIVATLFCYIWEVSADTLISLEMIDSSNKAGSYGQNNSSIMHEVDQFDRSDI